MFERALAIALAITFLTMPAAAHHADGHEGGTIAARPCPRTVIALPPKALRHRGVVVTPCPPLTPRQSRARPMPPGPIPLSPLEISLETVATGLTAPNWGTSAPGVPDHLFFVSDQDGKLWMIDLDSGEKTVFLDVGDRLVDLDDRFDERGFLGVAFHPDYASNGLLYLYTSEPNEPGPDFSTMPEGVLPDHQSVVTEWRVTDPTGPAPAVDLASDRELLRIDQPRATHNGGGLEFGPDGMLYISLGDGGGAGDAGTGHGTIGNGQDPGTVLGSVLRIDPLGRDAANGRYGIPADNPFVDPDAEVLGGAEGCEDGFCDEIYAYGFRNPFRFSFDRTTGHMLLGDVGQGDFEEIDVVVAGGNYGWNLKEGTSCYDPDDGAIPCRPSAALRSLVEPIAQYDHTEGHAIIGGFVYRGSAMPPLRGRYIFGDFLFSGPVGGRLFILDRWRQIVELRVAGLAQLGWFVLGFGEDANGELYLLATSDGNYASRAGAVLRIAP